MSIPYGRKWKPSQSYYFFAVCLFVCTRILKRMGNQSSDVALEIYWTETIASLCRTMLAHISEWPRRKTPNHCVQNAKQQLAEVGSLRLQDWAHLAEVARPILQMLVADREALWPSSFRKRKRLQSYCFIKVCLFCAHKFKKDGQWKFGCRLWVLMGHGIHTPSHATLFQKQLQIYIIKRWHIFLNDPSARPQTIAFELRWNTWGIKLAEITRLGTHGWGHMADTANVNGRTTATMAAPVHSEIISHINTKC